MKFVLFLSIFISTYSLASLSSNYVRTSSPILQSIPNWLKNKTITYDIYGCDTQSIMGTSIVKKRCGDLVQKEKFLSKNTKEQGNIKVHFYSNDLYFEVGDNLNSPYSVPFDNWKKKSLSVIKKNLISTDLMGGEGAFFVIDKVKEQLNDNNYILDIYLKGVGDFLFQLGLSKVYIPQFSNHVQLYRFSFTLLDNDHINLSLYTMLSLKPEDIIYLKKFDNVTSMVAGKVGLLGISIIDFHQYDESKLVNLKKLGRYLRYKASQ